MRLKDRVAVAAAPPLAALMIRAVALTMRLSYVGFDRYRERIKEGKGMIVAFWHGRLFMMPYAPRGNEMTVLVSTHKDGELIARTVGSFGVKSARGSTTRGWLGGIKALLKAAKEGSDIAITPDGPKGPRFKAQEGAILLASATGLPIFPITFSASVKKTFNSWDGFIIPAPFSRGVFICGSPVLVPAGADSAEIERKRLELETRLVEITERADGFFS